MIQTNDSLTKIFFFNYVIIFLMLNFFPLMTELKTWVSNSVQLLKFFIVLSLIYLTHDILC